MIVIKKINLEEVNLHDYETFLAKCENQGNLSAATSLNLSIEAANVAAKLSYYKSLLNYTLAEIDKELKHIYSFKFINASDKDSRATSDAKREAIVRQDSEYQEKLSEKAKVEAMLDYIKDCIDYATKMHYIHKSIYLTEMKIPVTNLGQI